MGSIWGSGPVGAMGAGRIPWMVAVAGLSQDCVAKDSFGTSSPACGSEASSKRITVVRQDQESEDLIGEAIRRAFKVQSRMPEQFQELLRRLARTEETAPEGR
jgi:hypothetical protein